MKMFFAATLCFIGSHAFAAGQPSILGEWNLSAIACTSNAPVSGGVRIGQDKFAITFNADQSFELVMSNNGCQTAVKGTYTLDGMKINYTSATSQSCKDAAPQPMVETYSMYVAWLGDTKIVFVATGDKAARYCPVGDAAILSYEKIAVQ